MKKWFYLAKLQTNVEKILSFDQLKFYQENSSQHNKYTNDLGP